MGQVVLKRDGYQSARRCAQAGKVLAGATGLLTRYEIPRSCIFVWIRHGMVSLELWRSLQQAISLHASRGHGGVLGKPIEQVEYWLRCNVTEQQVSAHLGSIAFWEGGGGVFQILVSTRSEICRCFEFRVWITRIDYP